jgi:hypothetical protein
MPFNQRVVVRPFRFGCRSAAQLPQHPLALLPLRSGLFQRFESASISVVSTRPVFHTLFGWVVSKASTLKAVFR